MSAPFMQLYVADYLGDTRHLTTEQHGAYLLILMTMWRSGGRLPNDPKKLARITGCTGSRWTKIAPEVLEFFCIEGGYLTSSRLTLELEKASEKSINRAKAGALGGKATALKNNNPDEANAAPLPRHSSEPEPDKKDPPTPRGGTAIDLKRFAKALAIAADAGCDFNLMVGRIHQAQPVVEGRRKTATVDVQRALAAALKRGGMPSAIWGAVQAYYALPASTKEGGQFASGAAVILNKDRWREYGQPAAEAALTGPAAPTFDGPPALRLSVVNLLGEPFARAWIDSCRWDAATRTLLARNAFGLAKLNNDLGLWMRQKDVRAALQEPS